MKKKSVQLLGFAVALASLFAPLDAAESHPLAPRFALTDLDGRNVDLSALRGHVVLIDFWATWCASCRDTIPRLIRLQSTYKGRGLRIVGVSLDDDASSVREFRERFRMNYPVVIGDAALAERYGGILGLPVAFLVGCDGRIAFRHDGEPDIALIEREIEMLTKAPGCRTSRPRR